MTEHCDLAKFSGAVSVGTATTTVLGKNEGRYEITIVNDGANVVYLTLGTVDGVQPTAVLNAGIRLNAAGGSWSSNTFRGPISAIAVTGATVITVAEI